MISAAPTAEETYRQGRSPGASAQTVAAIVAKGQPVYGINTGFGKLANVRIEAADLETLQRNIVLSHAAGVGAYHVPVLGNWVVDADTTRNFVVGDVDIGGLEL